MLHLASHINTSDAFSVKCVCIVAPLSTSECMFTRQRMLQHFFFTKVARCHKPPPPVSPASHPARPKTETSLPHMHQCLHIVCAPLSGGKFFMFGFISKCSFRSDSCISNWQSSERGSLVVASLTVRVPYNVVSAGGESELASVEAFIKQCSDAKWCVVWCLTGGSG